MIDNAAAHVSAHISAQPALLDRHSEWRGTARIGALLTDPGSVVLDIAAGQVPVRDDRGHDAQISLALRPPDDADAGGTTTVFLGTQPSGGAGQDASGCHSRGGTNPGRAAGHPGGDWNNGRGAICGGRHAPIGASTGSPEPST